MTKEKIHFVTGRLAESALRRVAANVADTSGFDYTIQVLPITVAALLTTHWMAPRLEIPDGTTRVILPGYSEGDLESIQAVTAAKIEFGPKDLRKLPQFFGQKTPADDLNKFDIQIIAEINHAPRMSLAEIIAAAIQLREDGADLIDVGCDPNSTWNAVSECVSALIDEGHRVSIDSLNPKEIGPAVRAGAELVLSVNESNREFAADWNCEVVVIPDASADIRSMDATIKILTDQRVRFRIDPILDPIGFGFANSLRRYMLARDRWPDIEIMMGIGNLTELSDVDSAGVNFLLLAVCQELRIHSILTTQVINWARTSVKECNIARRILFHSIHNRVPPKHISDALVQLRDPEILEFGVDQIKEMSDMIRDHNYRILAEQDEIHLLGSGLHLHDSDPFEIFDQLAATNATNLNPSHAFYLGYEMCKAMTALALGKQYTQDEALNWGHLTVSEKNRHRLTKYRAPENS